MNREEIIKEQEDRPVDLRWHGEYMNENMIKYMSKEIVCSKGHKKIKACLLLDDGDEYTWILIECVTCNTTLFYNGA